MTVIKSKRHESEMEFIHTARELRLYTTRKCAGFPKRYTFTVSNPLADSSRRIHQYCKMANSIYPLNAHEAQIRRDYLLRANAENFDAHRTIQRMNNLHNDLFIRQWPQKAGC